MEDQTKRLVRECNIQGGALLIYKVIMNVAVAIVGVAAAVIAAVGEIIASDFDNLAQGGDAALEDYTVELTERITNLILDASGWGYLLAIAIGLLILLLWKKPAFFHKTLLQRGKPMKVGSFLGILSIFLSVQLLIQLAASGLEFVLNQFDLSILEVLESSAVSMDSIGMLIYVGIAAPIVEEILFRGLILRSLEPYGKGFAIWVSAILFGFFHGNPIQTPFALLIGVILAYVTLEYNVVWAMVLHMINNLILGDTLPRLTAHLPYELADVAVWSVIILAGIAAVVYGCLHRRQIPMLVEKLDTQDWQWRTILRSPCVIIVVILSLIDMVAVAALLMLM